MIDESNYTCITLNRCTQFHLLLVFGINNTMNEYHQHNKLDGTHLLLSGLQMRAKSTSASNFLSLQSLKAAIRVSQFIG